MEESKTLADATPEKPPTISILKRSHDDQDIQNSSPRSVGEDQPLDFSAKKPRTNETLGSDGHSDRSSTHSNSPQRDHQHNPMGFFQNPAAAMTFISAVQAQQSKGYTPFIMAAAASAARNRAISELANASIPFNPALAQLVTSSATSPPIEFSLPHPVELTSPPPCRFTPPPSSELTSPSLQEDFTPPPPIEVTTPSAQQFLPSSSQVDMSELSKVNTDSNDNFIKFRENMLQKIEASRPKGRRSLPAPSAAAGSQATANVDTSKDEAYWERRKKNNEAAKRSRDARRNKENEVAVRAQFLEQENIQLKFEMAALRSEIKDLREEMFRHSIILNST